MTSSSDFIFWPQCVDYIYIVRLSFDQVFHTRSPPQVNGLSVVGHKHNEVVEMIRDSSHVTLTVIGKMATPTSSPAVSLNGTKGEPPPPVREFAVLFWSSTYSGVKITV